MLLVVFQYLGMRSTLYLKAVYIFIYLFMNIYTEYERR